ncbi:unnamed protein product, partial [Psylliodes chrysocephalus]
IRSSTTSTTNFPVDILATPSSSRQEDNRQQKRSYLDRDSVVEEKLKNKKTKRNKICLEGLRIVDAQYLIQQVLNLPHHGLFHCSGDNVKIVKEFKKGLLSKFLLHCNICEETFSINSENPQSKTLRINALAVKGAISIGIGSSQLSELPPILERMYRNIQNDLGDYYHKAAWSSMIEAGQEKATLAKENGEVDKNGYPLITVVADGSWAKRSYKTNYSSNLGAGAIIGYRTKKILYLSIKNKYCSFCKLFGEEKDHRCYKNWDGSSTEMESKTILDGFHCSMYMHGLRYKYLIADGDSSIYQKILESRPYGNMVVEKIECRNHLLRSCCARLRDIAEKRYSTAGKLVPVKLRSLLKSNILTLRIAIDKAAKHHRESEVAMEHKITNLKPDISNSPYHITIMAKITDKLIEKRRRQKRESEQRRRETIRNNPELHEQAKQKERERYYKRKVEGKIKSVNQLNNREKRHVRKQWIKYSKKYRDNLKAVDRENRFLMDYTPPGTPMNNSDNENNMNASNAGSGRAMAGRKRVLRKRSETVRKLKKIEHELVKYKKKALRYKTKYYRIKKRYATQRKSSSPKSKVDYLTKGRKVDKVIKQHLLFGEVLKRQLHNNFEKLGNSYKKKRQFFKFTTGSLFKKYRLWHQVTQEFGSYKLIKQQKTPKNVTHSDLRKVVTQFYERDDNSRMCPESLKNLHKKFASENSESVKLSYATFYKLRPFWVIIPTVHQRDTCLCVTHENMLLLVTKMKVLQIINESSPEALLKTICCEARQECIERKCLMCKDKTFQFNTFNANENTSFKKWITKSFNVKIKEKEKICKRILKDEVKCTKGEMIKLLKEGFPKYMIHVLNMKHQYKMIWYLRDHLEPEKEFLLHVDFSENYNCKYYREVQSAHFGSSKPQISMQTVVWYYKENNEIVSNSYCRFSESLRHDPSAILGYLNPLLETIKRKLPYLKRAHFCSDGPSTQYRNKTMFQLIGTELASILEVEVISWYYFESGHGKGAVDGVGGCLKRTADRLVACGIDIPNMNALLFHLRDACPGIQIEEITPTDSKI